MATNEKPPASSSLPGAERERIAIQDASRWILRIGVIASVAVLLVGLILAFRTGGFIQHFMGTTPFSTNFSALGQGLARLDPFTLMELGVLLLAVTPILRIFTAIVLLATEEHDRLHTTVTFLVRVMTLGAQRTAVSILDDRIYNPPSAEGPPLPEVEAKLQAVAEHATVEALSQARFCGVV